MHNFKQTKDKLNQLKDAFIIELKKIRKTIESKNTSQEKIIIATKRAENLVEKFKSLVLDTELDIAEKLEAKSEEQDNQILEKLISYLKTIK